MTTSCAPAAAAAAAFFVESARCAAVFRDQPADMELLHHRLIEREAERPLHGDDVAVGDARRLTGCDAFQRGQDAGIEPLGRDGRKLRQLFGPGGQQKVSFLLRQRLRRLPCAPEDKTALRQGAGRAEEAEIPDPRRLCRRPDVLRRLHCVGVGGVDAEGSALQESGHLIGQEPSAPDGDAGGAPLLFLPQRGGYADGDFKTKLCQPTGKLPPLGGTAEQDHSHRRYPRGVTIRPLSARVAALPTKTVVNISTSVSRSWLRGRSCFPVPPGRCSAPSRRGYQGPCRGPAGCPRPGAGSRGGPWRRDCTAPARNRPAPRRPDAFR